MEESQCASHGAGHCEWLADRETCSRIGETKPCDFFGDAEKCVAQKDTCDWVADGEFCIPKGMEVSCSRWNEEHVCNEKDKCGWSQYVCMNKADLKPCEEVTNPRKCQKIMCHWDEDTGNCIKQENALEMEGGSDGPMDPNGDPNHLPPTDEDGVDPNTGMRDFHGDSMHPEDVMNEPQAAGMEMSPEFQEEPLPDCTGIKCPDAPTECPEGEFLKKPTSECCPRCGYPEKLCASYHEKEQCPEKCEWHQAHYKCGGLGVEIPCDKLYDVKSCTNKDVRPDKCDWHKDVYACVTKGEKIPCDKYFEASSCPHNRCHWHDHMSMCWDEKKDIPCDRYYEQDACPASRCTYDEHAQACHEVGDALGCDRYYTDEGCNSHTSKCTWYSHSSRCFRKGEKVPCDALGKDDCGAHEGCGWDGAADVCTKVYDFAPLGCSEHFDEHSCTTEDDCKWEDEASVCYKAGEALECDKFFGEVGCQRHSHCAWHEGAARCHKQGEKLECDSFYSDEGCMSHSECEWDANIYHCRKKGEAVPCDKYYEADTCTTNGCNWNKDLFHCHGHEEKIPCDRLYDQKWCVQRDDCSFLKGSMRCHEKGATLTCDEFMVEKECTAHGCKFFRYEESHETGMSPGTNAYNEHNKPGAVDMMVDGPGAQGPNAAETGHCMEQGANMCSYHSEEGKCHPDVTPGCAWDSRGHRCRELRKGSDEL